MKNTTSSESRAIGPESQLDHVCLCVRKISPAAVLLEKVLGYLPRTGVVENTRQKVNVLFLCKENSIDIKLIEPSNEKSPLIEHLRQHGPGLHHLCFLSTSVSESERHLREIGVKITAGPEPGEAFEDESILFAFLGCGLNLEIIDTEKRRSLLSKANSQAE